MSNETPRSLSILGRQPALGFAELESLYGAKHVRPVGNVAAAIDVDTLDMDFARLGGSVKLAKVLVKLPHDWPSIEAYLVEHIPQHLKDMPAGKFNLGLSVYGTDITAKTIYRSLSKVKAAARMIGRSVRVIPNQHSALNSAQVFHNKLTGQSGWELLLVRDGTQTILAQTMFVQDISAYSRRDRGRPKRDMKVGMLPPKLAQIIVNLARPIPASTVLDPFCGTGVIPQEALLMGFNVIGSDMDDRMVGFTSENIEWLRILRPQVIGASQIIQGDATNFTWPAGVDTVASELYLGRPLSSMPPPDKFNEIVRDVNTISTKFLRNLAPQLKSGTRICLAIPAWRRGTHFVELPLIDHLTEMGYNRVEFMHASDADLIYWRSGQVVGRRLLVLTKV